MFKYISVFLLTSMFCFHSAYGKCPDKNSLERKISKIFSRKVEVKAVYPVKIDGMCKVVTDKAGNFFVDEEERYLIKGMIFKLPEKTVSKDFVAFLDKSTAFSVGDGEKTVYVIVDPECEACRKSKDKIKLFIENGVKLKFVLAPFSSKDAEKKAVTLLCSNGGIDMFMSGNYKGKVCTEGKLKVWSVMDKLKARGLTETPIFVTEEGKVFLGSKSIDKVIKEVTREGK